jgi:hypothetical protein
MGLGWDDMTEVDIEDKIKRFRSAAERLVPEGLFDDLMSESEGFLDPDKYNPVDTAEFLHHLDIEFLVSMIRRRYKREPTYRIEAMVRSMMYMAIKKIKYYTELKNDLKSHPDVAGYLGFKRKNGEYQIPNNRTFWHFDNVRLKNSGMDELFSALRNEAVRVASTLGIELGKGTVEDATPIKSLPNDKEPEYNGHYKMKGYKLDITADIDERVPLSKKVIGINEDEGKCLKPSLEELSRAGMKVERDWVDGKYATFENIAYLGTKLIEANYPINRGWQYNFEVNDKHLEEIYQRHWKDKDFRPSASIDYILSFLDRKGLHKIVGSYFRNMKMAEYEECPDCYLDVYHRRNNGEALNGYLKDRLDLMTRMRVKGKEKVDRYLTKSLIALLAVVLNRLQHGVKDNLISVAYLT